MSQILQDIQGQSRLAVGQPVDSRIYGEEVGRITNWMRENGYAFFSSGYIGELTGDSSNMQVDVRLEVFPPAIDSSHQTFRIGDINVFPGYDPNEPAATRRDTLGEGIYFHSSDGSYTVKPKTILDVLSLQKDSLFRQSDYDRTYKQLNNLGIFRIVSIQESRDTLEHDRLNFNIFLTPNDRFEFGSDLEINASNSPFIGRLFGVSGGISLRHLNIFHGAELFVGNLEGGVDLNLGNLDSLVNTVDVNINTSIYFPKFVDVFGVYKGLDRLGLFRDGFYEELKENASTRVGLGYNYLETIDLYVINSFNANIGYDFRTSRRTRFRVNHVQIDYFSPRTTMYFDTLILEKNLFLFNSFDKQLFTGFLLREIDFSYNSAQNRFGESYAMLGQLEFSGVEVFAANLLANALDNSPVIDTFALKFPSDTISFSQFIRTELDLRHYRKFNNRQSLALRFFAGVAFPIGYGESVPYVKQFFSGGPQSIRAWAAREIGPGGFRDPLTLDDNPNPLLFYQTGEFKLELNAEYRFNMLELFGLRFEGALFPGYWKCLYPEKRFHPGVITPSLDPGV